MDEFFQNLREIQKKERSLSSLSPVGDDFYQEISTYFNRLMERIDSNPFSFESYLLRDAQRIVVEICERREHKITNSAVMNVQRSHQLFKDTLESGRPNIPLNSTPEEEKLYLELYRSLAAYREEMRSPLISYSNKKDHKTTARSPSSKPSESSEDDVKAIIDNEFDEDLGDNKVNKQPLNTETPSSTEIRTNTLVNPASEDEIPPEIQDEIYRQFGREPSTKSSQDSSVSLKNERIGGTTKNSPDFEGRFANQADKAENPDENGLKTSQSASNVQKTSTEVLMILDELPSIMGVDSKVYGPFHPGDVIAMPEPNARILIKNHKGRSIQRYK